MIPVKTVYRNNTLLKNLSILEYILPVNFLHSVIFVPQSKDKMSVEMKYYFYTLNIY